MIECHVFIPFRAKALGYDLSGVDQAATQENFSEWIRSPTKIFREKTLSLLDQHNGCILRTTILTSVIQVPTLDGIIVVYLVAP